MSEGRRRARDGAGGFRFRSAGGVFGLGSLRRDREIEGLFFVAGFRTERGAVHVIVRRGGLQEHSQQARRAEQRERAVGVGVAAACSAALAAIAA